MNWIGKLQTRFALVSWRASEHQASLCSRLLTSERASSLASLSSPDERASIKPRFALVPWRASEHQASLRSRSWRASDQTMCLDTAQLPGISYIKTVCPTNALISIFTISCNYWTIQRVPNYIMMYCIKLSLPENKALPENKGCLPKLHFDLPPKFIIAQFEIEVYVFDEIYGSNFSTLWPPWSVGPLNYVEKNMTLPGPHSQSFWCDQTMRLHSATF
jgi:hypothetical protein